MSNESLKQKAYDFIKSKIVSCEYQPGSFINEGILMEEIGISRTPIREALSKLEQEDLVAILPKRGVAVSDLSINEINMIYETRLLIEPYIIEKYGNTLSKDQLKIMRESFLKLSSCSDMKEIYLLDDAFHHYVIDSSNNKYLINTMNHTYNQNYRLRVLSGSKVEQRIEESNKEHILMIDYMLAEDFAQAAEGMAHHLENARTASFKSLLSGDSPIILAPIHKK